MSWMEECIQMLNAQAAEIEALKAERDKLRATVEKYRGRRRRR